jgi:CDP-glucose 4,6-dehydratase
MGGYDPYSSSKGCSELVTSAFRNSFFNPSRYSEHGLALASARAGNVIGGGDWAGDRLIPDLIRAIASDQPAVIRNPYAIRPWQHVLEPLSGYLLLVERLWDDGPKFSTAWNFGSSEDDAQTVSWVADRLVTLWGSGASWTLDNSSNPHEAHQLRLDSSRAHTLLLWRPRWTLDEALRKTVAWFQEWARGADMQRVTREQIDAYVGSMAQQEAFR